MAPDHPARWRIGACVLALLLHGDRARADEEAPLPDAVLHETLALGEDIEARVDGDLDGDGRLDIAYAVRGDARDVYVLLRRDGPDGQRYAPAGRLRLGPDPRVAVRLSIRRGLLVVRDSLGDSVTLDATFRYRVHEATRMRLIGLDATLDTAAIERDGFEISWNLLDGSLLTRVLRVPQGGGTPVRMFEQTSTRPSAPVFMEDTPDPEMVMVELRGR